MLSYVDAFQSSSKDSSFTTGNIPLFAQCLLMSLLMFILTKQIPQMVQGLLSGSPQLTGASMTSLAKQGMNAGAAIASGGTAGMQWLSNQEAPAFRHGVRHCASLFMVANLIVPAFAP